MCGFAYCFSASAMLGWFSLVKTDVWRAEESFSFESRDWHSQIQVETFQHQILILNKPNGNLWPEIPTGPVWFWDFRWSVCFDFVIFPDCWISLNWRLVFVWNQIFERKNSDLWIVRALIKYQTRKHFLSCLCVRLSDGGTADTEHGYCGREAGSSNGWSWRRTWIQSGKPSSTGCKVEYPWADRVTRSGGSNGSWADDSQDGIWCPGRGYLGKFHQIGECWRPRGNIAVDQSDVVGPEGTKVHFTDWLNWDEAGCREAVGFAEACSFRVFRSDWIVADTQWWYWSQSQSASPELCETEWCDQGGLQTIQRRRNWYRKQTPSDAGETR